MATGNPDRQSGLVIAVDGPAASGKGTLAARIADHYGLPHLDTGLLYRATAHAVRAHAGADDLAARAEEAARALDPAGLDAEELTSAEVGQLASKIAVFPQVRAALFDLQTGFAGQPGGAVLDGRDIGTVICPEADVKLFVTASLDTRTDRRLAQLRARGETVTREELRDAIAERDARDSAAPHGGFRQAEDAHLLDTSEMDIDSAFRAALGIIESRRNGGQDVPGRVPDTP